MPCDDADATGLIGPNETISSGVSEAAVSAVRSRIMRSVSTKNSGPEMRVRRALHAAGFRFRLHDKRLPGTPDIVLKSRRIAIFVHGCFWHRHEGCRYASAPKTRQQFWSAKFARNVARDAENKRDLEALGWRVIEVWECEVKKERFLNPLLERIAGLARPK